MDLDNSNKQCSFNQLQNWAGDAQPCIALRRNAALWLKLEAVMRIIKDRRNLLMVSKKGTSLVLDYNSVPIV